MNVNSIDRINDTKIDLSGSLLTIIIFGPTYQRINETTRQSSIVSKNPTRMQKRENVNNQTAKMTQKMPKIKKKVISSFDSIISSYDAFLVRLTHGLVHLMHLVVRFIHLVVHLIVRFKTFIPYSSSLNTFISVHFLINLIVFFVTFNNVI